MKAADVRVSSVQSGIFDDELAVRSTTEAARTVLLDVPDGGRVEKVVARDGAMVRKGELLYVLANPTLQQQMVAREADLSQQTSNLSTLKASLQVSRADHKRRLAEIGYAAHKADRDLTRARKLSEQGFISEALLEDAIQQSELQRQLLAEEREAMELDLAVKTEAVNRMESLVKRLHAGLDIIGRSITALEGKAPLDGKLTDFNLKEGAILKSGDPIGRIDVPGDYKLLAAIDEFYLTRITAGVKGKARVEDRDFEVVVEQVNPQVKEGRFVAELRFVGPSPKNLSAGQAIDVRLVLAEPKPALLVEDGDFYKDTGGSWVFVLPADANVAERRSVRLGRRSNGRIEVLGGLKAGETIITSSYADFGGAQKLHVDR